MSKGFLGRRHSEETKQKIKNSRRGQHHSEQTKRKIRQNWRNQYFRKGVGETPATTQHADPKRPRAFA